MSEKTMVVFTYRPRGMILNERGSQAWSLKPANARRCTYIVCTRNRYFADAEPEVQAAAPEKHGAAFLLGKITSVEPAPDDPDRLHRPFLTNSPILTRSSSFGRAIAIWCGMSTTSGRWASTPTSRLGRQRQSRPPRSR
jgi:hypothetical protein